MVHLIELDPSFARSLFALANDTSLLPVTGEFQLSCKRLHFFSFKARISSAGNSRAKQQDRTWPLMCVGILFTKESIVALRSGALNGEINKGKAVMPVLHCFHHACFLEFSR